MNRHASGLPVLAAAVILLACVSCSHPPDVERGNRRPGVRLTGGPVEGDSVSYASEFFWTGWDEDGIIDHYQYAIDIPADFTLEEINGVADVGIAWRDTSAFRSRFRFTTSKQDSIQRSNNTIEIPERFVGDHTFYVRSVDNEGLVSEADFLSFTARNVTPRTRISIPRIARAVNVLQVGRQVSVAWEGFDPDSPDPRRRPAAYEWKLIPIQGINIITIEDPGYAIRVFGAEEPWNRIGADTTFLRIPLNPPEDYVFAIRAIDEAGGIEGHFGWGLNALRIASSNRNPGTPSLTLREPTLGEINFPGDGQIVEFEVPVNHCLRFDFSADAESYGGVVQGYNFGIDVADADDEGPNSGFGGWSLIPYTFPPICFSSPGIHTVTFKCRDTGGGVTIGTLRLRIVSFPMDRDVLYVDDYRQNRSGLVTDAIMDARARAMLMDAGFENVFQIDTFDVGDIGSEPLLIKLSELGRYRMIVWSNIGSGYAGHSALVRMNACARDRLIQAYVGAGGALAIYGSQIFATMRPFSSDNCIASLFYSRSEGLDFEERNFPCEYMGICASSIRSVRENTKVDGMVRGYPTARAAREFFPVVETDSTVFNHAALGGIPFVDAMFTPTTLARGGLDTLYTMGAARDGVGGGGVSAFNGKPIAFRYADPDPIPAQGPVAILGFPLHFLKPGSAAARTGTHGLMRSLADWFRSRQVVSG
jgi:hypothetical protein